jgi:sugar phosphate isomerase/epimerase
MNQNLIVDADKHMPLEIDRRRWLTWSSLATVATGAAMISTQTRPSMAHTLVAPSKVKFSLNTSTIHGEVIDLAEQIKIAAEAGYDAIEFWVRDVDRYLNAGHKPADIRKQVTDNGLQVAGAIAFSPWIVEDDTARHKGLEQAAREMDLVRELGGRIMAAPPVGATNGAKLDLNRVAERYRELIETGKKHDMLAQLEIWGFSANLSTLSEALFAAAATGHADACILADVYHLHKGGSNFNDLGLVAGTRMHVFHVNDFPTEPKREAITDAHRVYPGDGVAPLAYTFQTLLQNGFHGTLSLELFNREYWKQDPRLVAKTGLMKMKAAFETATANMPA